MDIMTILLFWEIFIIIGYTIFHVRDREDLWEEMSRHSIVFLIIRILHK